VPPEVKMTSRGFSAATSWATFSLEASRAFLALFQKEWEDEGFPEFSMKYGFMSSKTLESRGIPAP